MSYAVKGEKMKNILVMTLTVAAVLTGGDAFAVTLEVGPNRTYRTIQAAADVAKPGDVVLIDPGVYREWVKPANAGTKDAPITYRAREKGKTVITGADVVTGWTKRADGLWEVQLPYDAFGGFNPFTDFIAGNWYWPAKGVRNPRTALFRGNEKMCFRERVADFGARQPKPEYLVNLAGLTVGGRTVAGDAALSVTGGAKPEFDTRWGRQIGYILPGATLTYDGFAGVTEFTVHYSSLFDGAVDYRDGAADGEALGSSEFATTESWKNYADHRVKLAKAPASGRLVLVFRHRSGYGKRVFAGSYTLQKGMVAGTIVADFRDDPNDGRTELVVRPCCFYPTRVGRDYQRLEGLVIRDGGPNWAGPHSEQPGLVGTNWSRGWTIEDCEISGSCCAGITLGKHGDEYDNYAENSQRYTEAIDRAIKFGIDKVGHHTVRRCRIHDCGQAGICGSLGAVFSTIEACDIGYCFWNENFNGAEMACIKLHAAVDVVIADNVLHHSHNGATWMDWMGQGTRITRNLMHSIVVQPKNLYQGAIFFEVGHGPAIVDNNVILARRSLTFKGTQSIACVGNVVSGAVLSNSDERRTPIWKPHSVSLWEMCNDCSTGGHRYFNNVMAARPQMNKDTKYQTLCEGNGFVPSENWTIYADGRYEIRWPEGVERPSSHPVDTARLGKSAIIGLPFENHDGTPYVWDSAHSPAAASLK